MCLTAKNKIGRDMHQASSSLCTQRRQQRGRFGIGGLCLQGLILSGIHRSVSGGVDDHVGVCFFDGAREGSVVGDITLLTAQALNRHRLRCAAQTGAAKLSGSAEHQRPLNAHRCASSQSK